MSPPSSQGLLGRGSGSTVLRRRKPPRASLLVPKSSGSLWGSESPFCCGTQGSFCCDSPQGVRGTWLGHEPCSSKGQAETRPRDFSGVPGPTHPQRTAPSRPPPGGDQRGKWKAQPFSPPSSPGIGEGGSQKQRQVLHCTCPGDRTQVLSYPARQRKGDLGTWGIFQVALKPTLLV